MKHKFNVGDEVKIVFAGQGFGDEDVGKIVTITKLVDRPYMTNCPGYAIKEPLGNFTYKRKGRTGYGISVGERSFKLHKAATLPSIKSKKTLKKSELLMLIKLGKSSAVWDTPDEILETFLSTR